MKYQKELTNKLRTDIIYPITVLNAIRLTDEGEGFLADLLDDKVDKDGVKVLSTNDYTTAEKTKLYGIQNNAQVNQNAFSTIKIAGQVDVRAEHVTENLTFIAGSNVTLTTNPVNKTVSIAATGNSGIYVGADEPTDPDAKVWLDVDGEPDTIQASAVTNTPSGNILSTNVQGAINELDNEKVDKVTGKGLSTNDYTSAEKNKVANLPNDTNASLANKVDRVTGKSLVSDTAITDLTDGNETTLHKHDAANTPNTPSGNISSTTVQGAINELDTEKADKLFATNLVTNGDFSNGTTGWNVFASTNSVASNTLSNTGNGTSPSPHANQNLVSKPLGTKIYYRTKVRAVSGANLLRVYFTENATDIGAIDVTSAVANTWYNFSGVVALAQNNQPLSLKIRHFYADSAAANSKVMEVQYVQVLNLTTIFGAGKEPTKEQMDWLLAQKYANSWFNGTQELTSITDLLTLVNTKANITQEAWITPTLLNGATGTLKYRKNQFGTVEIYADLNVDLTTLGTIIAELMIGYRPQLYHPMFRAMNVTAGSATDIRITNTGKIQLMGSGLSTGNKLSFVAYFIALG